MSSVCPFMVRIRSSILLLFSLPAIATAGLYGYTKNFDAIATTTTVLDRRGNIIGTINPQHSGIQYETPLSEIPQPIIQQTLEQEDRWFYWHPGFNPVALFKATLENLAHGRVRRGGSTISQQLAKLLMQNASGAMPKRTLTNKFKETLLAIGLEAFHGKDWILERYLNLAYYGHHAYGITAASKIYFAKSPEQLTDTEVEQLVQIPKAPGRTKLTTTRLPDSEHPFDDGKTARHFLDWMAQQNLHASRISSTLDLNLQKKLEEILPRILAKNVENDPALTAAAIVIDVPSGDLLAMVGSRDYFDEAIDGQVNATVALRQPGSTLKPFTYFAAFAKGLLDANSLIDDAPSSFYDARSEDPDSYIPQNFDRRYHGAVSVRQALANSYNVPAVITLNEVGLSFYIELLRQFGITQYNLPPNHYGLALTLGDGETTLLNVTNAYAALARGGRFLPWRVQSNAKSPQPIDVIANAADYATSITQILSDAQARVKAFGYNNDLNIQGAQVAVKTGTSYNHRDNWTVGYNGQYAVGVWVGHADGSPLPGTTGASGAGPYWHAILETLMRSNPQAFTTPALPVSKPVKKLVQGSHQDGQDPLMPQIATPMPNSRYRVHAFVPIDHQKILAQLVKKPHTNADEARYTWYLDDIPIASDTTAETKVWIDPIPGRHQLVVADRDGRQQKVTFRILSEFE